MLRPRPSSPHPVLAGLTSVVGLALTVALVVPTTATAQSQVLRLTDLGDPDRRGRTVTPVLDAVLDTATGDLLGPAELARELDGVRLVLAGESHTSQEGHDAQLALVEALHGAGREVIVGLEMFPAPVQAPLDQWSKGLLTEEGFLQIADWYSNWGFPWGYYRDIFLFARDHELPMIALNAPRDVVRSVGQKGIDGLTEEERVHMPPSVDLDSDDHLTLFKSYFSDDDAMHSGMDDDQWRTMLAAQSTWDAAMAWRAVEALRERPDAVMVVLVGSGHVAYGLGIERQARALGFEGDVATVIPLPVADLSGEPVGDVAATYADYLWGLSPAAELPVYPSLGLSTRTGDDGAITVLFTSPDTPAERAGIAAGDVVTHWNGSPLGSRPELSRRQAETRWGETVVLGIERGEEKLEVPVVLRRKLEADGDETDDAEGQDGEDDAEGPAQGDGQR